MIIVMNPNASDENIADISKLLHNLGLETHLSKGTQTTIIGIIGEKSVLKNIPLELMPGVEKLVPIMQSYKLANRSFKPEDSVIEVGNLKIGGPGIVMIAGPCAVEDEKQILNAAKNIRGSGAKILRGGAYKPRTSPYSFQGLEEEGYALLSMAAKENDLLCISEIVSEYQIDIALKYLDMIQIGARNMQNFRLLKEVGKVNIPVLLKRGNSASIDEWLDAAEYIMNEGNHKVILCERGIRTFETSTRNTLDISSVPVIKSKSHLPIIIDPSHAAGKAEYVPALSKAAIAAGADGLIIEVHPNPLEAVSDAAQQLNCQEFDTLYKSSARIAEAIDRFLI